LTTQYLKDKIQKRRVNISYTPEEFVATLGDHVPDRYRHAIRYLGLLAPGSKARISASLCTAEAAKATSSTTVELGIPAAEGLWSKSPH